MSSLPILFAPRTEQFSSVIGAQPHGPSITSLIITGHKKAQLEAQGKEFRAPEYYDTAPMFGLGYDYEYQPSGREAHLIITSVQEKTFATLTNEECEREGVTLEAATSFLKRRVEEKQRQEWEEKGMLQQAALCLFKRGRDLDQPVTVVSFDCKGLLKGELTAAEKILIGRNSQTPHQGKGGV